MNTRGRELISKALKERFHEVTGETIPRLSTGAAWCDAAPYVQEVHGKLSSASLADVRKLMGGIKEPVAWMESRDEATFRAALFACALGYSRRLYPDEHPPVAPFIELLITSRADPKRRVQLLTERYANPLNFTLPAEKGVREFVLTRLMAHERARIEKGAVDEIDADDLLVMLNYVAVHAGCGTDLRFLDALNYYYELLPSGWHGGAKQQGVLLASYLALYAGALAAWIREDD
jgi:hypothetical protein